MAELDSSRSIKKKKNIAAPTPTSSSVLAAADVALGDPVSNELPSNPTTTTTKKKKLVIHRKEKSGEEEYDSDSSLDEQGTRNRAGNVPLKWYEGSDHFGYDIEGNRLMKPKVSALQQLIARVDDPQALRTIWDFTEQEGHVLTDRDLQVISNLIYNKFPNPEYNAYPDLVEYVDIKPGENPFDTDRSKKSFLPPIWERKKVANLVRELRKAIKAGKFPPKTTPRKDPNTPYLLWDDYVDDTDSRVKRRQRWKVPPPRMARPNHAESYNPSPEFLPTEDEVRKLRHIPEPQRNFTLLPSKFESLRSVPFWKNALRERYRRCLDLFDVARTQITRTRYRDPDQLLPSLPSPQDLRPYPCKLGFEYKGHTAAVHALSTSKDGEWLATGCDDGVVRIFEVTTGKLMFAYALPQPVQWVEFNPNPALYLLAALSGPTVYLFVPPCTAVPAGCDATRKFLHVRKLAKDAAAEADALPFPTKPELVKGVLKGGEGAPDEANPEDETQLCVWKEATAVEAARGLVLKLVHHATLTSGSFHRKGDYLAVVSPKDYAPRRSVVVHILSQRQSINPFKKLTDTVQAVRFFPSEEDKFCLMSKRRVSIYNLLECQMVKKLKIPKGFLSCVDIHSAAENRNLLLGNFQRDVLWYDLDLGEKPYKVLRTHAAAVRCVAFHGKPSTYPLFATASDDGQVHVYHGTVFAEYTKNAYIVPLKILKGHVITKYLGVLQCQFHPVLPWLFTSGGDGKVYCWIE